MEDGEKKLAWVVDKGDSVHADSGTLLLREVDGLMRGERVSSSLLSSFESVFVGSLAAAGSAVVGIGLGSILFQCGVACCRGVFEWVSPGRIWVCLNVSLIG